MLLFKSWLTLNIKRQQKWMFGLSDKKKKYADTIYESRFVI